MTTYLIELKGEQADLEDLPTWFPDGTASVSVAQERYYLASGELDACASPAHALERAEVLLDEMYAVGLLLWPAMQRPQADAVVEIDEQGQRRRHLFDSVHESVRLKDRAEAHGDGTHQLPTRPTDAQRLLSAARKGKHIQNAMLIWSDPHRTWPRLYRIVEELEGELHGTVSKLGFCSDNERDRLMQSANSASVAGKDSRHAAGKLAPPRKPMSLQEATSFVATLLHKALLALESRGAA